MDGVTIVCLVFAGLLLGSLCYFWGYEDGARKADHQ